MRLPLAAAAVLLLAHGSAAAEDDRDLRAELEALPDSYSACLDTAVANTAMTDCASEAHARADEILNAVYAGVFEALGSGSGDGDVDALNATILARLKTAQRAWIPFRDADCALRAADVSGGTLEGFVTVDCLQEMTAARASQLLDQLDKPAEYGPE